VHEIRKYKFYDIACSDVLFVEHRYHYKFVGLAGSGIDPATDRWFERSTVGKVSHQPLYVLTILMFKFNKMF